MRRIVVAFLAIVLVAAACYRNTGSTYDPNARTVLEVQNQGFDDMNVYVLPEGGSQIRLGLAGGKHNSYFDIPQYIVQGGLRSLRFVARPIATTRGPVSNEITVTPGDTVQLIIPPA